MRAVWRRLRVLITGYDAEQSRRELDSLRAAFEALPKPRSNP